MATSGHDLVDLLEDYLAGQLAYHALWDEFESAPRETRSAQAGALDAIIEADPRLGNQLEILLAEYYAASSRAEMVAGERVPESLRNELARGEDLPVVARSHTVVVGEGAHRYTHTGTCVRATLRSTRQLI